VAKKRVTRQTKKEAPTHAQEHLHWDFMPIFPPHPEDLPEASETAEAGDAFAGIVESQCGTADDSQPVEQYDGTLGVTAAFVTAHQAPVGQLQWNTNLASIYDNPGNVSGVRWCTGTLISNDLFLSAGHCFDQTGGGWQRPLVNGTTNIIPPTEIATNMHVNFNYQVDPSGVLRPVQAFAVIDLVEYRLGGLDFSIARLDGSPGATFGTTQISTSDGALGDMMCIIQHPAGVPKRIEAGPLFHLHDDRLGYNDIDTLGGSSGSGVLQSPSGRIIGVHTNGGCNVSMSGHNHGVRITSIIAQSPTIQGLTAPTLKFGDDTPTLKFSDDTMKFSDDVFSLKFNDDAPTLKFSDDGGTLKFSDDTPTLKFSDDGGTLKFSDDTPTLKFSDDGGGGTLKFSDDGGTLKFTDDGGTLKAVDDVKAGGLDKGFSDRKSPGLDTGRIDPGRSRVLPTRRLGRGVAGGARPFVLSTPHHSMAWAGGQQPGRGSEAAGLSEETIVQYENALTEMHEMMQQGMSELAAMDEQYQTLYAEYEAVVAEYQRTGR